MRSQLSEHQITRYFHELVDEEDFLGLPEQKKEALKIALKVARNGHYNQETRKIELR